MAKREQGFGTFLGIALGLLHELDCKPRSRQGVVAGLADSPRRLLMLGHDPNMAGIVFTFSAKRLLEASQLSQVFGSITYTYDLAAVAVGSPVENRVLVAALRGAEEDWPSSGRSTGAHRGPLVSRPPIGMAYIKESPMTLAWAFPENRPRWRPRLSEPQDRLQVRRIEYGSPLVLELVGDAEAWIFVVGALAGKLLPVKAAVDLVEQLATMKSRIRAANAKSRVEQETGEEQLEEILARRAAAQQRAREEVGRVVDIAGRLESVEVRE